MTLRQFLVMVGLIVVGIPSGAGVIWMIDAAAGTAWALPVAAMVGLPMLAVTFREPRR